MEDIYAPRTTFSFVGDLLLKSSRYNSDKTLNTNFKATSVYRFEFKITDMDVGDVKQPLKNLLVNSNVFEIQTRGTNENFVVGNYILFEDELYIIKSVAVAHSPMQYVYYNIKKSIFDTTRMTIEKVQQ